MVVILFFVTGQRLCINGQFIVLLFVRRHYGRWARGRVCSSQRRPAERLVLGLVEGPELLLLLDPGLSAVAAVRDNCPSSDMSWNSLR